MKKRIIEYACISSVGRLRRNNEDNFYCDGHIRADVDSVEDIAFSGEVSCDTNELFAVFDGMGGEACGEVAAYIAASQSAAFAENRASYEVYLYELAELLNEKIREETAERSLVLMGTTAAMLQASGDDVFILNAGDSRIYKLSAHVLRQISEEHIVIQRGGKAITKFLGLPEGYALHPYIAAGKYIPGDVFLLCSDGVTDMLADEEIRAIIDDKRPLSQSARALVDAALEHGGADNTTAILLRFN